MTRRVLLLGGLDPSGGAGITLDATVAALHGVEALPIALSTTVQGKRGFVRMVPIDARVWREQVETVCGDGDVHAVKVGFVGSLALMSQVCELLSAFGRRLPVVVDPVLGATAGGMETDVALARAYVEQLAPHASLITPNTPELTAIAGGDAGVLLAAGAGAVLHKGGHGSGCDAVDELFVGERSHRFARPRLDVGRVRGTGCALATAIATELAQGMDVVAACRSAGDWLARVLGRLGPGDGERPRHLPFVQAS